MKLLLSKTCQKFSQTIPVLMCLSLGTIAGAESAAKNDYVVGVTVKKVRLYDAALKPIDVLSAKKFKKMMIEHQTPEGSVTGIQVVERAKDSAIISVKLPDYDEPVWLGIVGLELSNKKKIPCPSSKLGLQNSSNPGVTIGFGDSCEAAK